MIPFDWGLYVVVGFLLRLKFIHVFLKIPLNSEPLLYPMYLGLGYQHNHAEWNASITVSAVLSLSALISNQPVAGSIIVRHCRVRVPESDLIIYFLIRSI